MNFEELESVRQRLERMQGETIVAFAVKQAARILPLLALGTKEQPPFWFWPETKRPRFLGSIFSAVDIAWQFSKTKEVAADAVFQVDETFNAATAVKAADIFKVAFSVASYAAFGADGDAAARTARTAAAAAFRADDGKQRNLKATVDELRNWDLVHLCDERFHNDAAGRAASFLALPLWGKYCDDVEPLVVGFTHAIDELFAEKNDCPGRPTKWSNWYLGLCRGTVVDVPADIASLGPAAIYAYRQGLRDGEDRKNTK
jgi:hypothetical protein